jgi:hypothetical protein
VESTISFILKLNLYKQALPPFNPPIDGAGLQAKPIKETESFNPGTKIGHLLNLKLSV